MPKAKNALSFKANKGNYEPIFWNLLYNGQNIDITSLESIDWFTSQFGSEQALKGFLAKHIDGALAGTFDPKQLEYSIVITSKANSKAKEQTVPYGVCYSSAKDFINYNFLQRYVQSKIKDKEFLRKFANHFFKHPCLQEDIGFIYNYLEKAKTTDIEFLEKKYVSNALKDIIQFSVYGVHCEVDDYLTGMARPIDRRCFDYDNLRNIAMFVASIEQKRVLEQDKDKAPQIEKPEQTSLFDIFCYSKKD